jgi:hypothetical protein
MISLFYLLKYVLRLKDAARNYDDVDNELYWHLSVSVIYITIYE